MNDLCARLKVQDSLNLGLMKQKTLATIAIIEGLILFGLLANSLGWFNFVPDFQLFGCGGEIYETAQSPDKTLTAYAFQRDCGATTGFSTFVIVRLSSEKLDLTEDLVEDEIVFVADGNYKSRLRWTNLNRLQVTFSEYGPPETEDIHFQNVKRGDVAIEYRGLK